MIEVNVMHPLIGFVTFWQLITGYHFGLIFGIYGDSLNAEGGRE
jgi:hypothetical protein